MIRHIIQFRIISDCVYINLFLGFSVNALLLALIDSMLVLAKYVCREWNFVYQIHNIKHGKCMKRNEL